MQTIKRNNGTGSNGNGTTRSDALTHGDTERVKCPLAGGNCPLASGKAAKTERKPRTTWHQKQVAEWRAKTPRFPASTPEALEVVESMLLGVIPERRVWLTSLLKSGLARRDTLALVQDMEMALGVFLARLEREENGGAL